MPASRTPRSRTRVVRGTVTTVVLALALGLLFGGGAFAQLAGALGYGGYGGCGYICPPPPGCGGYGGYSGYTPPQDCGDPKPDVSIWASTQVPYVGSVVTLNAHTRPHDITVAWDLDDDGAYDDGTGREVSKTFATTGRHVIRLRGTDRHGRTAFATQTFSAHAENLKPTGSMSVSPSQPRAGTPVSFSGYANDHDGRIVKYEFDYDGDGTYDAQGASGGYFPYDGSPFVHTYSAAGKYEAAMRVTDDAGASTVTRRTVAVHEQNLKPIVWNLHSTPERPRVGTSFSVEPSATDADGHVVKYEVDYDGDGTYDAISNGQHGSFQHTYTMAGEHELVLRVTDDAGAVTVARRIVSVGAENIKPSISFWIDPDRPRVGVTVFVNAYATDIDGTIARLEYDLDGDGAYETTRSPSGAPVTTVFQTAGTHTLRARAIDNDGAARSAVRTFDVVATNLAPRASLNWSPSTQRPELGATTTFYGYSQDPDGSIAEYAWDLDGDGEYDDQVGPNATEASKTFTAAGEYLIGLRVTDADGATDARRERFVVVDTGENMVPLAKASADQEASRVGRSVSLNGYGSGDSDGYLTSWEWDLDGDGAFETTGITTEVTFGTPGDHEVSLRVTDDDDAQDVHTISIPVHAGNLSPEIHSLYVMPLTPRAGVPVDVSAGADDPDGYIATYAWELDGDDDFDDVEDSTSYHAVTFDTAGEKTIKVRVLDDEGAAAEKAITFDVREVDTNLAPQVSISAPSRARTNTPVPFSAHANDPDGQIQAYDWDLDGDGTFGDSAGPWTDAQFATEGTYDVRLRVTDDAGAIANAVKTIRIDNTNLPPTVDMYFTPAIPSPGQPVSFSTPISDPEQSGQATVRFDWGDGTPPTESAQGSPPASHTFAAPGYYEVKMTATDTAGASSSITRTVRVSDENLDPTVGSFSMYPYPAKAGDQVSFMAWADDPDGTYDSWSGPGLTYAWELDGDGDFNDAASSFSSRLYPEPGVYEVGLRITDARGGTATTTKTLHIASQPPEAGFSVTPENPTTDDTVRFDSTTTDPDGTIASTEWDLDGDGEYDDATGASASRRYTEIGEHKIAVRVRDDNDDIDTHTRWIQVRCGDCPVAAFTYDPSEPASGQEITLTSTSTDPQGPLAGHAWDLDSDGMFDDATGATAKVTFQQPGTFEVGLRVTDSDGKKAERYVAIRIGNREPTGQFTWTPATPRSGDEVTFTATASDIDGTVQALAWDTDADGQYDDGTGTTATRTYNTPGNKLVRLRITDDAGGQAFVGHVVTIANRPPVAAVTHLPASPLTNQTITFSGTTSSDPDGGIAAYDWDLDNDGAFDDASTATATRQYDRPGVKTVKLRVRDTAGEETVTTYEVTVGNRVPVASFTVSPEFADVGEDITFTSTSTDPDGPVGDLAFAWDVDGDGYDDGTTSSITRSFPAKDTYTIKLRVTDADGGVTDKTTLVAVGNDRPLVSFTSSPDAPLTGQTVTFTSTSTDPDGTIASYAWDTDGDNVEDFTDGTGATASRSFGTPGTKVIRLKVTDNRGGSAVGTATVTIGNRAPNASFTASDETLERDQLVKLTSNSTDSDGPVSGLRYEWDKDGDGFDDGTTKSIDASYAEGGTYTIRLKVTDAFGGEDIAERTVTVRDRNLAPSIYVWSDRTEARTGQEVTFYASAYDNDGDGIARYEWDVNRDGDFDDAGDTEGQYATQQAFTFAEAGTQTVQVRVTDGLGESAIGEARVTINAENKAPYIYLSASTTRVRVGADVTFFAWAYDSDDGVATYEWDTNGDGDYDDAGDQSGPSLTSVTVTAPAGVTTMKVGLRVKDSAIPAAMDEESLTIDVKSTNTAPVPQVGHYPYHAQRGEAVTFYSWYYDEDSDRIVKYEWDLDGDGTYDEEGDVSGEHAHMATRSFATAGTYTVNVRLTDEGGAVGEQAYRITVRNSPPQAVIAASTLAPEINETITVHSESTDADGTIAKTEWDTDGDGDFDDGLADGTARMTRDVAGVYHVHLLVTDNDGETSSAVKAVTFRNPSNVGIPEPERVELPGGAAMNIGTTINPQTGQATITVPNGEISRFDPENRCVPLTGDFRIKAGTGVVSGAVLVVRYSGTEERIALEHLEGENWRWRLKCALNATLLVAYDLTETDTETGEEITETFLIPIGGIQLIDPQGVVYDQVEYAAALAEAGVTEETASAEQKEAARAVAAIAGATVRLQRFDAATNAWKSVLAGDPGISPNVNPQTTGDNGLYQWDVSAGVYRVLVSAPGYAKVESTAVTIPPPVLDLHIPMVRNAPPTAVLQVSSANVARGEQITLTSQSEDVGGTITATEWDLDGDGQFDDADGTVVTHAFDSLGVKTVKMRVTDNQGGTDVATQEITVVNAVPTAALQAISGSPTGTAVAFAVDAADADGSIESIVWDLDEDGLYDDGTGATVNKAFDRSGTYPVRVRVTDNDGGVATDASTVTITNRVPTATLGEIASVATGTPAQLSVSAADLDGSIASIGWELDDDGDFDDAVGATASKAFARSGSYPVKVRVTDDEGAAVTREGTVVVTNRVPTATLGEIASVATGTPAQLSVSAADLDGSIASIGWELDDDGDFDDAVGATASKAFARSGSYPVKVRVTDDEGAAVTREGTVVVTNRAPSGTLVVPSAKPTKTTVEFSVAGIADADGLEAPTVRWDLDDDGAFDDGTGTTATREFARSGSYPVRARITDDQGASVTESGTMTIINRAPTATLADIASVATGTPAQFAVTVADADGLAAPTIAWDLDGDGEFDDATGATASRSFARSGTYPVKVRVTDDEGVAVTREGSVVVTNRAPTGSISGESTVASLTDATFIATGIADADGLAAPTVAWDVDDDGAFDDGTGASVAHTFTKAGARTVRLRITDDQNESTVVTKAVTVTNRPPTATLTGPAKVKTGEDAVLEVAPVDADGTVTKVEWDLDEQAGFEVDGGKALSRTATFSKSDASRVVKVKVTDDDGGSVIAEHVLVVENRGPAVSISLAPDAPKAGAEVTFTATASDADGSVKTIEWDLDNDGGFDDATGESAKRAFPAGSPTVKVRVTDDEGATAVAEKSLTVAEADKPVDPPVVTPPVVTPPADTTAPNATAKGIGSKIKAALSKGVVIELTCDEACTATGEIKLDARTAKKLGLGKKAIVIASGKGTIAAGEGKITMKFTSKAKKALKKQRKAVKLKAIVTLIDAAGNRRTVPVTITLKK